MATRDHGCMSRSRLYVTVVCCELAYDDVQMTCFCFSNKRVPRVSSRILETMRVQTPTNV
jgi:hypothetical protein